MLDFPANPTPGQQFTAAGVTWIFDGAKWTPSGLGQAYLPLSGGTLTGPLVLNADPTIPLGAATAEYADKPRYGDNRIINGDMRIDQRNNGASGTAYNVYTVDRWAYSASQAALGTWGQNLYGHPSAPGFPYYLGFQSSSAYAVPASETYFLDQPIEADAISDLQWGTVNARPVTLSFWCISNQTGTFSGAVNNGYSATRSYPFTFSIPTANVWTNISLTIPGDTAGIWTLSGNTVGLILSFDLGSGSAVRGPANAWAAAAYWGATGAVSVMAVLNATFAITGVKLEIGSVATPFNRQSLAKTMVDCQRYYQTGAIILTLSGSGATAAGQSYAASSLHSPMRATATMALVSNNNGNLGAPTFGDTGSAFFASANSVASGGVSMNVSFTASAEL